MAQLPCEPRRAAPARRLSWHPQLLGRVGLGARPTEQSGEAHGRAASRRAAPAASRAAGAVRAGAALRAASASGRARRRALG